MASSGLRREKHLLTLGIIRVLDTRYAHLVKPFTRCKMLVTNLRNRHLIGSSIDSMDGLVMSLYHNLLTGCKDFPDISVLGYFRSSQLKTPFPHVPHRENTSPSPLEDPPGLMVPPADSDVAPQILTPVLPEKVDLSVVKGDRRNCVRTLDIDGITVTRVISTVYRTDKTEMANRWRVTDYSSGGNTLMSVLCQFVKSSARRAKRQATEDESSSRSPTPPRKRLRL